MALKGAQALNVTSPSFGKCAFFAFRIRHNLSRQSGITTLYSGHIASESLTLLVMMLSMISGK